MQHESRPPTPLPARVRPRQAHGLRRWMLMGAGWFFLAMASLGAALPGIPTTPWVLSAAYCFDRSSPRFSRWLRSTPVFGKLIADWERYRGIRKRVKITAIATVLVVVSGSILFSPLPTIAKWIIGVWACIGIGTIGFVVPTVPDQLPAGVPVSDTLE